jgi:hypothetical protein
MVASSFRFVCVPAALAGAPAGWPGEMLRDGEIALLADDGGFDALNEVMHTLGLTSVPLIRAEESPEGQQQTVIAYAGSLPLVWVAQSFNDASTKWARDRGPMTLLVTTDGPLPAEERRRIDRFVASLGRQSE